MKALLFTILLLVAAEFTNGCNGGNNDDSKCYAPDGGCLIKGTGPSQQVWLLKKGDGKTCYNVSTPDCKGHGQKTLAECLMFCVSE
uniref:Putative secreted protein n=1 Tax=Amblyomma americanum TaxID=6943 RepID=A0A0C9R3Q5_AMBAM